MKRYLLIGAGIASLSLGVAGALLPILPTTPFVLLSAVCFLRSSDRLYRWVTSHRWFGPYIRNYLNHRAVTVRSKVVGIAVLWAVISASALLATELLWVRLALLAVAIGVTIHLIALKTLTREMLAAESADSGEETHVPVKSADELPAPDPAARDTTATPS